MSKPMAVSLPVVLLILDWYPFQRIRTLRSFGSAIFEKTPFVALALFSSVLTYLAKRATVMGLMEHVDLKTRILVAAKSLFMYLWKMLFPHPLIPLYEYPEQVSIALFEYLLPLLLFVAITTACVVVAKKKKLWLTVWAFYVITLLPVIGILQVGIQSMADRYTYIPGIGPFLVVGVFSAWIAARADALSTWSRAVKYAGASLLCVILVILSLLTMKQTLVWKDSIALYDHIIHQSPAEVSRAYYNRGVVFSKKGETDKAIADFEKVIHLSTGDYDAYAKLGILYGKAGSFSKAIETFDMAIRVKPDYPLSYGNRGYAYSLVGESNRGYAYSLVGESEKAIEDFSRAIALDNGYVKAYVNRGNLYLASGRKELAADDFQKACDLGDGEACKISRSLKSPLQGNSDEIRP
jgi:tetratricopeptide (TPR) repeat protein